MANEQLLQELNKRFQQGQLNESQSAIFQELQKRGVVPSQQFDIATYPVDIGKQRITSVHGENLRPEQVIDGKSAITMAPVIYEPSQEEYALAQKGVETREGGPFKTRLLSSLANRGEVNTYVAERIEKDLGYPTQVRIADGRLQFLAKDKKDENKMRWATFDEEGFTPSDIAEVLNDITPAVAETLTMVKAAPGLGKIKSTPGAIATESALMGAVGTGVEAVRGTLGQILGVRDEPYSETLGGAIKEGAETALITAGAGSIISLGQKLYRRSPFNREETDAIVESLNASDDVISEINQRIRFGRETEEDLITFRHQAGGAEPEDIGDYSRFTEVESPVMPSEMQGEGVRDSMFRPDLAQRTGSMEIADKKETIKQGVKNAKIKLQQQSLERENWRALEDYFDIASGGTESVGYDTASKGVQRALKQESNKILARYEQRIAEAKAQTGRVTDKIPEMDLAKAAKDLRLGAEQERAVLKDIEDKMWEKIRAMMGYDPNTATSNIKVPSSETLMKTITELKAETKQALGRMEGETKIRLLKGKVSKDEEFDLSALNRHLSYLRGLKREIKSGLNVDRVDLRDVDRLLSSLEETRNTYLKDNAPDLYKAIKDAEQVTAERAAMFDEGVVGKILAKKGNSYYLDDKGTLGAVISARNGENARRYATAIMGNPQAMQGSRNMIHMLYKQSVEEDGVIVRKLHDKFMKEYGDTIKPFFREDDWKRINKLGELGRVVEVNNQKLKEMEKAMAKNFRGKLQDVSPINVANAIFDKNITPNDIAKLSTYASGYGDGMIEKYRAEVARELKDRIMSHGQFSSDKLYNVLKLTGDSTGEPGKIYKLFGPQFAKDIRTLYKGIKMIETKGIPLPKPGESYGVIGAKAAMGPLHPQSRLVTALEILRLKADDKIWSNVIQNPEKLRAIVNNMDADANSRRAIEVFALIGLNESE